MDSSMFFLTLVLVLSSYTVIKSQETDLETYIVHVELPSTLSTTDVSNSGDLQTYYNTFLPTSLSTSSGNEASIVYSYHNVFKGFAVRLSPAQMRDMERKPGFISAHPQQTFSLHTTHSPNFLGLNQNSGIWRDANYGQGVIIGLLDSGINPDHPSFSDEGMPPPPARWRGVCEFNPSSLCNNKLIGARSFTIGNGTPFDEDGHGTHTASTAAGNFVSGANVFGNANGTAAGIAPRAHLATYKVCIGRCSESDILRAMDIAIDDGVDVISLSLGGPASDFISDSIGLATFSAIRRGIFVSAAAGNRGPSLGSVENGAPWVLTVGASTTDRTLRATAVLGNNEELNGESTYQPSDFPSALLPLVYPRISSNNPSASYCTPASLQNINVQGRIVLCETGPIGRIDQGRAVRDAGGAAMILINQPFQGYTTISDSHVLPATYLSYADGQRVVTYANTSSPMATISFGGTIIGNNRSPTVESYSARGPNRISLGILKPDIIGPGANILAAWFVSVENNTNIRSNFNIISGTSMSCPHLSGVAALLRNMHPNWSPAAIKSAIMTSADQVNLGGNPIEDQSQLPADVFATGSGHVNALRAANPGLIYDIQPQEYISYLCGLNQQVAIIVNPTVGCSNISSIEEAELNYPSFVVFLGNESRTYNRTVTNVGDASSSYTVAITGLTSGASITVNPNTLQFTDLNQNLTYQVTFTRLSSASSRTVDQGSLTWTSARHSVRSPIAIRFT